MASMTMASEILFKLGGSPQAIAITAIVCLGSYLLASSARQRKLDNAIAKEYGCQPVIPQFPYKWPLALDLLKQQYEYLFSEHTFQNFNQFVEVADTSRVMLFGITGYHTMDPKNVEAILATNFEDYSLGARRLASLPLLGEGIFGQDGPAWKHSRELIRRQFVRVHQNTPESFKGQVDELIGNLKTATARGEMVDLRPYFFEYTLSTTTELLFGEPHSSLPKEEMDAVRDNFDFAALGMGIRVRLADAAFLYNPAKFRKACSRVREWASFFANKALSYREEVGEERAFEQYPFVIDLWREMGDINLVRDQLLHILIAGRDSTAAVICWTFFHLIRNPLVLKRLKQEVSTVPVDRDLTKGQLQKLTYLRCCLNEILRLYPSLPLNIRFTNKTTVLPRGGGSDGNSPVMLPKGTGIAFSIYHLHRLESIYGPDAKVFRPERWESGELIKKARSVGAGFVDFNLGPRLCLGRDFALMEASYAIIRIVQEFPNIRLPPGVANEPLGAERQTYTIAVVPSEGVQTLLV